MTSGNEGGRPALLGGEPAHPGPWPSWPVHDAREREALLRARNAAILRDGLGELEGLYPQAEDPRVTRRSYHLFCIRVVECPNAERACREVAWLPQWVLLADEADMEAIVAAARKIRLHAPTLA